jgi:integrase
MHAYFVLAVMLGLRRGELLGLHWSDVDIDGGSLRVVHTLQRVNGALHLVPPKTMSSVRTVPLPALCVDALRRHLARQEKERTDAGRRGRRVDWSSRVESVHRWSPTTCIATGSLCRPRSACG